MTSPSVLIIGAGPTGLTAAIELKRLGFDVRIIDRGPRPSIHAKATTVNARSLELLEPSGITDKILKNCLHINSVDFHHSLDSLFKIDLNLIRHKFNFAANIPQSETEQIMENHLKDLGVNVEWKTEFLALNQTEDAVEARIRTIDNHNEEIARTDYLLAADGVASSVRKHLGIKFEGDRYKYDWNAIDAVLEGYEPKDSIQMYSFPNGQFLVIEPFADNVCRIISTASNAKPLLPDNLVIKEEITNTNFYVSHRLAETFNQGRVFLAGDAGHTHPPTFGRGMNLGVEDACAFAFFLANGQIDKYGDDRRNAAKSIIRQTNLGFKLEVADNPVLRALRKFAAPILMSNKTLQSRLMTYLSGITSDRLIPDSTPNL